MRRILRDDEEGVAAAVATMLALVMALLFMQVTIISAVPAQQYAAEFATSKHNLDEFNFLRSMIAGPVVPGTMFSIPIQMGTAAVSPFATTSQGTFSLASNDSAGISTSFTFVPSFRQASVQTVHQDVVLVMDNSGSMAWNDPTGLRITGAQQYVGRLSPPDCTAVVAFNSVAVLTQANVGGTPHHLWSPGFCGTPDYSAPQADLATISNIDGTNIGLAIQVANNELISFGHPPKAQVEILLTDGQNNYAWQDALTISEAQRAAAHNITIYTIGLSDQADAALLGQVASITGGTYYAAPTAASIRWIYYNIAMHYQSSVQCGNVFTSEAYGGSVSLTLRNSQYPSQTLRLESGGVAIVQSDGATLSQGLPFKYTPTGGGGGSLQISLVTLIGNTFQATGSDTRFLQATILARNVADQAITRVGLPQESAAVGNISANVTYWANQGAATPGAATAVTTPLNSAQGSLNRAQGNVTKGNIAGAKMDVTRARNSLAVAINQTEAQRVAGNMQAWLAKNTEDSITLESCRIGQWVNWYNGLSITVTSSLARAWFTWFNTTFSKLRIPFDYGISGSTLVVFVHQLDRITTDRRVISLSGS